MNYLDAIIDALYHLGGEAHIHDICEYILRNNTLDYIKNNKNWESQVSNSITTHCSSTKSYKGGEDLFYTIELGSGIWGLNNYKKDNFVNDEDDEINISKYPEGSKKIVLVNAYERNPDARKACINFYKRKNHGIIKCEICGFNFGEIYGQEFSDKIEIHHLKEISSIGEIYEVDAEKDLIPICPNCHMIAHSRKPAYTPDEIRNMIKNND